VDGLQLSPVGQIVVVDGIDVVVDVEVDVVDGLHVAPVGQIVVVIDAVVEVVVNDVVDVEDVVHVVLNRGGTDRELARDLLVGAALLDERQNFALARRQVRQRRLWVGLP